MNTILFYELNKAFPILMIVKSFFNMNRTVRGFYFESQVKLYEWKFCGEMENRGLAKIQYA